MLENTTEYIYDPSYAANATKAGVPTVPPPGDYIYLQPVFNMLDKQYAAFGETNFKFTDTWNLTAGLRYSHIDYTNVAQETGYLVGGLLVNSTTSGSNKPFTPRYVLNYQPSQDSLYYASAAKGFRPGGQRDPAHRLHRELAGADSVDVRFRFALAVRARHQANPARAPPAGQRLHLLPAVEEHPAVRVSDLRPRFRAEPGQRHRQGRRPRDRLARDG